MSAIKGSSICQGAEKKYFAFLEAGNWKIQYCQMCDSHIFYPKQYCPKCGEVDLDWVSPSGLGTVYSISRVYNPTDLNKSHDVLLVDLDEGVRMMSCSMEPLDKPLTIGSRVSAHLDIFDGVNRIVFKAI